MFESTNNKRIGVHSAPSEPGDHPACAVEGHILCPQIVWSTSLLRGRGNRCCGRRNACVEDGRIKEDIAVEGAVKLYEGRSPVRGPGFRPNRCARVGDSTPRPSPTNRWSQRDDGDPVVSGGQCDVYARLVVTDGAVPRQDRPWVRRSRLRWQMRVLAQADRIKLNRLQTFEKRNLEVLRCV